MTWKVCLGNTQVFTLTEETNKTRKGVDLWIKSL
jgi:hypothetical protein